MRAAALAQVHAPELGADFGSRAETYAALAKAAQDVGGNTGGGVPALTQSSLAADRLRQAVTAAAGDSPSLHNLATVCRRVDARVVANIETGFRKHRYLVAAPDRVLAQVPDRGGVHRTIEVWKPMTLGDPPTLLTVAEERLRPPAKPYVPLRRETSREAYRQALELRASHTPRSR
jgi:hypothetical protein